MDCLYIFQTLTTRMNILFLFPLLGLLASTTSKDHRNGNLTACMQHFKGYRLKIANDGNEWLEEYFN